MQALRRRKNITLGPDGLQYGHIKPLGEKCIRTVVQELNEGIQKFIVAEDWLHGYLQQLLNPQKDPTQ